METMRGFVFAGGGGGGGWQAEKHKALFNWNNGPTMA